MGVDKWALIASIVFSGLWSGLLAMLTMVMHPMMAQMDGAGFARFLGAFLPVARKAPINYAAVFGMLIAPVVALLTIDDSGSAAFLLTAVGLALIIAGPLLVSNRLAEPNYDVILAWQPDRLPAGWEAIRRRYYALNWIRAAATWVAFGLFLAALVEVLS
jgi:hypothetical protein